MTELQQDNSNQSSVPAGLPAIEPAEVSVVVPIFNNAMPERNRYVRGLRAWLGFRQTAILFERPARFAGQTRYSFGRLVGLATDAARGWASTIVVVLFLGGVQLICIGVIGEFIGRIYDEVRQRPLI